MAGQAACIAERLAVEQAYLGPLPKRVSRDGIGGGHWRPAKDYGLWVRGNTAGGR
jgi:hypothetical protein